MLWHAMLMMVVVGKCCNLATSLAMLMIIRGLLCWTALDQYFGGIRRGESVLSKIWPRSINATTCSNSG